MLESHSSLNPLPLDIKCTQVVRPDVRSPCALPWAPRDLVPWCMILLVVIRTGGKFGLGPLPWEVTFSRLMCSVVGEPRIGVGLGLGVTVLCSPEGAGRLVGPVCWAPGPPLVWLVGKGGQAEG